MLFARNIPFEDGCVPTMLTSFPAETGELSLVIVAVMSTTSLPMRTCPTLLTAEAMPVTKRVVAPGTFCWRRTTSLSTCVEPDEVSVPEIETSSPAERDLSEIAEDEVESATAVLDPRR
jgi:hypothetical protein